MIKYCFLPNHFEKKAKNEEYLSDLLFLLSIKLS